MRVLALILALSLVAAAAGAQPRYGDLVLSYGGFTGYFSPANPGSPTTLATPPVNYSNSGVCMAPNNTDLVTNHYTMTTSPWTADLVLLYAGGGQKVIAKGGGGKYFSLDHDNKWILIGVDRPSLSTYFLYSVDHDTGVVVTYWSRPFVTGFEALAIDRDPGALAYAIASWGQACSPRVLQVDRQGNTTTVVNCGNLTYVCAALHPRSGDYILGNYGPQQVLVRVTKAGVQTTMASGYSLNGIKITQDDMAWCAVAGPSALKVDLSTNAVVTVVPAGSTGGPFGIEVYGSRPLVCRQLPANPRTVTVDLKSQHPQAAGKAYLLAASFGRRPGVKFGNGEWLDLDVRDPLFYVSALNLDPSIFANFLGSLDASGKATATVNIPPDIPLTDSMAVFVAGVIMKNGTVLEVTNSHWFLL